MLPSGPQVFYRVFAQERHERNRAAWYFRKSMKLAGFLLLPAGWVIVLTAIALLPPGSARGAFLVAGLGVEALGIGLVVRGHMPEPPPERGPHQGEGR